MKTTRMVVATDGSIQSDIATAVLRKLPFPPGLAFTVATVIRCPILSAVGARLAGLGKTSRAGHETCQIQHQIAEQTVQRLANELAAEGNQSDAVVLDGDAAEQLLDLVKREEADVMAIGCGANTNFFAFFLGSTSRKIVLYSEVTVLVGRPFSGSRAEDSCRAILEKNMLDILVAVDGSPGSALALESLSKLQKPKFRNVYILAVDPQMYLGEGVNPAMVIPGFDSALHQIESLTASAAVKIGASGNNVECLSAFGRPSAEISRVAEEKEVDLIMLGANQHGALDRLLVGSCAYETATSAPCSVLMFRDVLPFQGADA